MPLLACNNPFTHRRVLLCGEKYKFWELVPRQGVECGYLFTQTDSAFFYIHNIDNVRHLDRKKNRPHDTVFSWKLFDDSLKIQYWTHYIVKLTPDSMVLRYLTRGMKFDFDTLVVKHDTFVVSENQRVP